MAKPMGAQPLSRDEFRRLLGKLAFPVAPNVLADEARRNGAPEELVTVLSGLPWRVYMSDKDAWEEYLRVTAPRREG